MEEMSIITGVRVEIVSEASGVTRPLAGFYRDQVRWKAVMPAVGHTVAPGRLGPALARLIGYAPIIGIEHHPGTATDPWPDAPVVVVRVVWDQPLDNATVAAITADGWALYDIRQDPRFFR